MALGMCSRLGIFALVCILPSVLGHGRLIHPPSRSSMWRYGFPTPPNYGDNQLYCGGVQVQYAQNGGSCGICGDPYQGPRDNEAGGKYANGIIVETYLTGETIEIVVDLTANHLGWMEFKLCPWNNVNVPITQQCLDQYPLIVTGTGESRVSAGSVSRQISTLVDLPAGVTCTQCVVQWRYHAGNSWGTDPDGTSCVGCGDQEEFYGCADIAISDSGEAYPDTSNGGSSITGNSGGQPPVVATPAPTLSTLDDGVNQSGGSGEVCRAANAWTGQAAMDAWCVTNCAANYCPATHCVCEVPTPVVVYAPEPPQYSYLPCQAIGALAATPGMDNWCSDNCVLGDCPPDLCACDIPYDDPSYGGTAQTCPRYIATGVLGGIPFADDYCHLACNAGADCPYICECDYSGYSPYGNCYASSELLRQEPGMNAYCQVVCDERWCPAECACDG